MRTAAGTNTRDPAARSTGQQSASGGEAETRCPAGGPQVCTIRSGPPTEAALQPALEVLRAKSTTQVHLSSTPRNRRLVTLVIANLFL